MNISLQRFTHNDKCTFSTLYVDGRMICFALEDTKRDVKIKGETRIPAGRYEIKLRAMGRIHESYLKKFSFHKGMLWLQDVPNFQYIYIHIGNDDQDTLGCLLVGLNAEFCCNHIAKSEFAYRKLYPIVLKAIEAGEKVYIHVVDELIYS